MERDKKNKLPEFQSLDEEKEYWEARGPLAEGRKGRINKPRHGQKRSSFLSVRLTGEEITALREVAAIFFTKPSELARGAILDTVKRFKLLHETDQKEQEKIRDALRYDLNPASIKPLDFRIRRDDSTLNDADRFLKRFFDENPKAALYYMALFTLRHLLSESDKSVAVSIQESDDTISH